MIARNQDADAMPDLNDHQKQLDNKSSNKVGSSNHWYSIPRPVRRVFNRFPIVTYAENNVPQRTVSNREENRLYVFKNIFDPSLSGISCNPACLKWQAFLKFNNIDFVPIPSNNHASPSGSLPFLIPAPSSGRPDPLPLIASKISLWTSQQTMQEEDFLDPEHEAYMALVDTNIRHAWLYHLYLVNTNFEDVACPLYVHTTSSNTWVQLAIAGQLRNAAQTELLKSRQIIDADEIYAAAKKAFNALSTLLRNQAFFSQQDYPGLFDASVFAYTHLLLDQSLPWENTYLSDLLREQRSLIEHHQRILNLYIKD